MGYPKLRKLLAFGAIILLLAEEAQAGGGAGVTAEPALLIPLGARADGMGSAFTALADDSSALYYNPAGMSRLPFHEFALSYLSGISDNNLQDIAYAGPLPFSGLSDNGDAAFGASLLYNNDGTINVNTTNPDGSYAGSSNFNAGNDLIATMGYSERLGRTELPYGSQLLQVNHYVGVSGEYIKSTLAQQYSAETAAGSAGYLADIPALGLSVGASLLNMGGRLRYIQASDPLPSMLKAGVGWTRGGQWGVMEFDADVTHLFTEEQQFYAVGGEYRIFNRYAVRLGYQYDAGSPLGLTAGFGFNWNRELILDVAWLMSTQGLNDQMRLTLSYRFGRESRQEMDRRSNPHGNISPSDVSAPALKNLDQQVPRLEVFPDSPVRPSGASTLHEPPVRQDKNAIPGWQ